MPFDVAVPSANEATAASGVHLRAMDANLLSRAQFPGPVAWEYLRGWLTRNTLQHVRDADKGVLVARDPASGRVASFVKWLVHAPGGGEGAARDLEAWSDVCDTAVLQSYGDLCEAARTQALGASPYYHVTFLCTDPAWAGRGAATTLLRRVQELAAADGMAIILEATAEGVPLYTKMGFRTERELSLTLPPRRPREPGQPYQELCMVWTPPTALADPGPSRRAV